MTGEVTVLNDPPRPDDEGVLLRSRPAFGLVPLGLIREACAEGQTAALGVWAYLDGAYGHYVAGIFPGHGRLAVELGVSRSTVQRALRWLEAEGWLEVEHRFDEHGRQRSNTYTLHDAPASRVRSPAEVHARHRAELERRVAERRDEESRAVDTETEAVDKWAENAGARADMSSSRGWSRVTRGRWSPVTHNSNLSTNENYELEAAVVDKCDPAYLERVSAARAVLHPKPAEPELEVEQ